MGMVRGDDDVTQSLSYLRFVSSFCKESTL